MKILLYIGLAIVVIAVIAVIATIIAMVRAFTKSSTAEGL